MSSDIIGRATRDIAAGETLEFGVNLEHVYLSEDECAALAKNERVHLGRSPLVFAVASSPGDDGHPVLLPPPWTIFYESPRQALLLRRAVAHLA